MKTEPRVFISCVLLSIFLTNIQCVKDDKVTDVNAIITGFDYTKCGCCWGHVINFDGNSTVFSGNWYLVKSNLESWGIRPDSQYPINVTVTYDLETRTPCDSKQFVVIRDLKIR